MPMSHQLGLGILPTLSLHGAHTCCPCRYTCRCPAVSGGHCFLGDWFNTDVLFRDEHSEVLLYMLAGCGSLLIASYCRVINFLRHCRRSSSAHVPHLIPSRNIEGSVLPHFYQHLLSPIIFSIIPILIDAK